MFGRNDTLRNEESVQEKLLPGSTVKLRHHV